MGGAAQDLGLGASLRDDVQTEVEKARKKRMQQMQAQRVAGPAATGSPAFMSLTGNQY